MHHPIGGVGPVGRSARRGQVAIDAHEQHRAVDADPLDVGHVMIGRADPGARSRDDGAALCEVLRPRRSKKVRHGFSKPSAAAGRRGSRGSWRVVEPVLAGALRVVATRIDGEGVAGRGRERQRIHEIEARPGRDALDRRAHVGVGPARVKTSEPCACCASARLRSGSSWRSSPAPAVPFAAKCRAGRRSRRHRAVWTHVGDNRFRGMSIAEDHEVARDRDRGWGPADIVDGRNPALKHDDAADDRARRRAVRKTR